LSAEREAFQAVAEWNHYRVEATTGRHYAGVNGKVVSGGASVRRARAISAWSRKVPPAEFRNLQDSRAALTSPTPEEIAVVARDFTSLYTGVDLSGWTVEAGHKDHWQPKDWTLNYDGKSEAQDKTFGPRRKYSDFVLMCDWRFPGKGEKRLRSGDSAQCDYALDRRPAKKKEVEVLDAGDRAFTCAAAAEPGQHVVLAHWLGRSIRLSQRSQTAAGSAGWRDAQNGKPTTRSENGTDSSSP